MGIDSQGAVFHSTGLVEWLKRIFRSHSGCVIRVLVSGGFRSSSLQKTHVNSCRQFAYRSRFRETSTPEGLTALRLREDLRYPNSR